MLGWSKSTKYICEYLWAQTLTYRYSYRSESAQNELADPQIQIQVGPQVHPGLTLIPLMLWSQLSKWCQHNSIVILTRFIPQYSLTSSLFTQPHPMLNGAILAHNLFPVEGLGNGLLESDLTLGRKSQLAWRQGDSNWQARTRLGLSNLAPLMGFTCHSTVMSTRTFFTSANVLFAGFNPK